MREILFRGKRVDDGEWVEGYYIKANHHWHEHGIHEDWIAVDTIQNGGWCNVRGKYAVLPETVGQYTGLTDKNGTKIFEGDIVKDSYGRFEKCFYSEARKRLLFDGKNYTRDFEFSNESEYEVIGNIHDNPELLGGGNDA